MTRRVLALIARLTSNGGQNQKARSNRLGWMTGAGRGKHLWRRGRVGLMRTPVKRLIGTPSCDDRSAGPNPVASFSLDYTTFFLDQRVRTALRQASLRSSGVMLAALAFPPFAPPLRPSLEK